MWLLWLAIPVAVVFLKHVWSIEVRSKYRYLCNDLHDWSWRLLIHGLNFRWANVTLFAVLLVVCNLYDWMLQLLMAGPEIAQMGCYYSICCTACYLCICMLWLVMLVSSSHFSLFYVCYDWVNWFPACSCLNMEYFIVNNSETCVEETICVVRVQKPGRAGGSQGKS